MTNSLETCPLGPGYHVHLAPAAAAVAFFVMALVSGSLGWWGGTATVFLLLATAAGSISMRHSGPGG